MDHYKRLRAEHIKAIRELKTIGEIQEALQEVREYLDYCGYVMPKPKYKYDPDNIKTWRFLGIGRIYKDNSIEQLYNTGFMP